MRTKNQASPGEPLVYKKMNKQIYDFDSSSARIDREMDRFVGKTANDLRWKMMKKKYSVTSALNSRKNSGTCLSPEVVLKVQAKQRQRMYTTSLSFLAGADKMSRHTQAQNIEAPEFFNVQKKNLSYLQQTSVSYNRFMTQQKQTKIKMRKRSWYCYHQKKKSENVDQNRAKRKFEHPVMNIYKSAMQEVVKCYRSKSQFSKPFGWFVSPFDLDDF